MSRIVRSRSADRQRIVLRHAASTTQHVASGFGETCEVTLAKDVSANNQRLCLDGSRVAQMSDTQPPISTQLPSASDGMSAASPIPSTAISTSFASRTSSAPTAGSRPPGAT
jgi:hypothetical protein